MAYLIPNLGKLNQPTASARSFQSTLVLAGWFAALLGLSASVAWLLVWQGPHPSYVVWLLYFLGAAAIIYKPRYGIYLVVGLGLAGDTVLSPWFPFTKNFSSRESLLFLHDAVIINPLESYLALIFLSWFIGSATRRRFRFYGGDLFRPALVFLGFVVFGLIYGIATRGDVNIALWEARPLFYLVGMLILTSNLLKRREHVNHVMWAAMIGLFFEGLTGVWYYMFRLRGSLEGVNAITEHPAAIHMNSLFVFFLAVWLYKASPAKRIFLPVMLPVVFVTYIATQRRAAFITLGVALLIIAVLLFIENRRAFWIIVPLAVPLALGYMVVFWNANGALGLPVQAVKSVIAPGQASYADQASNAYRDIENLNLRFTIRSKPLTGVGFGQKFYVVYPLPNISWFQWWQYFPHNSIIWIWLKMGAGGFLAMLYLFGLAFMTGARVLWRMPRNDLSAVALTAVLFLVMQLAFAYVDIGWDVQSMLYAGLMMGLLNKLEHIVAQPVSLPEKRWRWQPERRPLPGLLPLPSGGSD